MEKAAARKEAEEAQQRAVKIEDQLRDIEAKGLSEFKTESRRGQLIKDRANARKEMKAVVRRAGELNDRIRELEAGDSRKQETSLDETWKISQPANAPLGQEGREPHLNPVEYQSGAEGSRSSRHQGFLDEGGTNRT